jgi:hypothetical protein
MNLKNIFNKIAANKKFRLFIFLVIALFGIYHLLESRISTNPSKEASEMLLLEETKKEVRISKFETDGCSGNVSEAWSLSIRGLSALSKNFAEKYEGAQNIPFEDACVRHDKIYYLGAGGYDARLQADNKLRADIISYGINNAEQIRDRASLKTKEDAIFMYEIIAEAVYRGVRLGGGPCTGQSYAWGYGYNSGVCSR